MSYVTCSVPLSLRYRYGGAKSWHLGSVPHRRFTPSVAKLKTGANTLPDGIASGQGGAASSAAVAALFHALATVGARCGKQRGYAARRGG